jgi:hypothetical protein
MSATELKSDYDPCLVCSGSEWVLVREGGTCAGLNTRKISN